MSAPGVALRATAFSLVFSPLQQPHVMKDSRRVSFKWIARRRISKIAPGGTPEAIFPLFIVVQRRVFWLFLDGWFPTPKIVDMSRAKGFSNINNNVVSWESAFFRKVVLALAKKVYFGTLWLFTVYKTSLGMWFRENAPNSRQSQRSQKLSIFGRFWAPLGRPFWDKTFICRVSFFGLISRSRPETPRNLFLRSSDAQNDVFCGRFGRHLGGFVGRRWKCQNVALAQAGARFCRF